MSWIVTEAVDYKGFPADRSKTGGWIPAALILGLQKQSYLHHSSVSHVGYDYGTYFLEYVIHQT